MPSKCALWYEALQARGLFSNLYLFESSKPEIFLCLPTDNVINLKFKRRREQKVTILNFHIRKGFVRVVQRRGKKGSKN